MTDIWDKILKGLFAVAGAISGALGGWDALLRVLCAFMVIDYATGLIVGGMGRSAKTQGGGLDSKVGFIGLLKKAMMLTMVFMAAMLDSALSPDMAVFRNMMMAFYIANEGLSILENLALAGVPFPAFIKTALEQIRERSDEMAEDAAREKERDTMDK